MTATRLTLDMLHDAVHQTTECHNGEQDINHILIETLLKVTRHVTIGAQVTVTIGLRVRIVFFFVVSRDRTTTSTHHPHETQA